MAPTYVPTPSRQQPNAARTCAIAGAIGCGTLIIIGIVVGILLFRPAATFGQRMVCEVNLEDCFSATMQYTSQNDGVLPGADSWQATIMPYLEDPESIKCWESERGYAYNADLSGVKMSAVEDAATTPLFADIEYQSDQPGPHEGGWTVIYVDGHIEFIEGQDSPD